MKAWQRWVHAPQTSKFRRVLFQVHLWLGIAIGLYILVISVSGSAVVLRPQFSRWFVQSEVNPDAGPLLAGTELQTRIAEVYSQYTIQDIIPPRGTRRAVYVSLFQDGEETGHYFDQYRGVDLGNTYPWQVRTVEWLTLLHDDLLMDRVTGRRLNAIGGGLFIVMVLSGIVLWWQGRSRWNEGLQIKRVSSHSFVWQLHSFLGFWSLLLLFVWGITAIYFAFPQPFEAVIDAFDNDLADFERPDGWLLFMIDLHFGRFRGSWPWLPYLWVILGLLPAVMFISGFILWYRRVLKKSLKF